MFRLRQQILPSHRINVPYLEGGDGSSEEDWVHDCIQSNLEGKCLLSLVVHPTFAHWGLRSKSSMGSFEQLHKVFILNLCGNPSIFVYILCTIFMSELFFYILRVCVWCWSARRFKVWSSKSKITKGFSILHWGLSFAFYSHCVYAFVFLKSILHSTNCVCPLFVCACMFFNSLLHYTLCICALCDLVCICALSVCTSMFRKFVHLCFSILQEHSTFYTCFFVCALWCECFSIVHTSMFLNSLSYILHYICASVFLDSLNYILHSANLCVFALCV
jgi:hypothetical protein